MSPLPAEDLTLLVVAALVASVVLCAAVAALAVAAAVRRTYARLLAGGDAARRSSPRWPGRSRSAAACELATSSAGRRPSSRQRVSSLVAPSA